MREHRETALLLSETKGMTQAYFQFEMRFFYHGDCVVQAEFPKSAVDRPEWNDGPFIGLLRKNRK
jgi:hypothetical protein